MSGFRNYLDVPAGMKMSDFYANDDDDFDSEPDPVAQKKQSEVPKPSSTAPQQTQQQQFGLPRTYPYTHEPQQQQINSASQNPFANQSSSSPPVAPRSPQTASFASRAAAFQGSQPAASPFLPRPPVANRPTPAAAPAPTLPISTSPSLASRPSGGPTKPPKAAPSPTTTTTSSNPFSYGAPVSTNPFSKPNTTTDNSPAAGSDSPFGRRKSFNPPTSFTRTTPPASTSTSSPTSPSVHRRDLNPAGSAMPIQINAGALAVKYPSFNASEISAFHQAFASFDKEGKDAIHQGDLPSVATKTGESYQAVTEKLQQLKLSNDDGYVSFEGFLKAVAKLRQEKGVRADKTKITLGGASENITHTINEDEKESFVTHINQQLADDKDIKHRLPIDKSTMQVFGECKDGLILSKLINDAVPGTIDERVLNVGKKLSPFQMIENNNVVVNSAKAIGCSVVNIGSQDIMEGREHLILGLIWQIIKIGLSAKVDIKVHPELFRLLEPGEVLEDFLKLPTDQILLRWFNYHLKKAGWSRKVTNFSSDVKDGENYTVLLNQLAPELCSRAPLQERDLFQRAEMVLTNADKLGCRKYLTPKTLVGGNPKLNFAFVANLFNHHPGLEALTDTEKAQLDDWLFGSEGDREARAFALWLNSLGVEPFVNNLFDDLRDGLVLLQAMDKVRPGLVEWKKVNKAPVPSKFKKVENTNYVVLLGKQLRFSLVGIQGSDITDGNKTLTLGLVWQLMREHVVQTLKTLSKDGKDITDNDMINWANATVSRGGKSTKMSNFKDPSLRSGIFFLDLINGMKKGVVNYDMVTRGVSDDDAKMNAKYAISIARKLGATIFVLPEDIVEVKSKMQTQPNGGSLNATPRRTRSLKQTVVGKRAVDGPTAPTPGLGTPQNRVIGAGELGSAIPKPAWKPWSAKPVTRSQTAAAAAKNRPRPLPPRSIGQLGADPSRADEDEQSEGEMEREQTQRQKQRQKVKQKQPKGVVFSAPVSPHRLYAEAAEGEFGVHTVPNTALQTRHQQDVDQDQDEEQIPARMESKLNKSRGVVEALKSTVRTRSGSRIPIPTPAPASRVKQFSSTHQQDIQDGDGDRRGRSVDGIEARKTPRSGKKLVVKEKADEVAAAERNMEEVSQDNSMAIDVESGGDVSAPTEVLASNDPAEASVPELEWTLSDYLFLQLDFDDAPQSSSTEDSMTRTESAASVEIVESREEKLRDARDTVIETVKSLNGLPSMPVMSRLTRQKYQLARLLIELFPEPSSTRLPPLQRLWTVLDILWNTTCIPDEFVEHRAFLSLLVGLKTQIFIAAIRHLKINVKESKAQKQPFRLTKQDRQRIVGLLCAVFFEQEDRRRTGRMICEPFMTKNIQGMVDELTKNEARGTMGVLGSFAVSEESVKVKTEKRIMGEKYGHLVAECAARKQEIMRLCEEVENEELTHEKEEDDSDDDEIDEQNWRRIKYFRMMKQRYPFGEFADEMLRFCRGLLLNTGTGEYTDDQSPYVDEKFPQVEEVEENEEDDEEVIDLSEEIEGEEEDMQVDEQNHSSDDDAEERDEGGEDVKAEEGRESGNDDHDEEDAGAEEDDDDGRGEVGEDVGGSGDNAEEGGSGDEDDDEQGEESDEKDDNGDGEEEEEQEDLQESSVPELADSDADGNGDSAVQRRQEEEEEEEENVGDDVDMKEADDDVHMKEAESEEDDKGEDSENAKDGDDDDDAESQYETPPNEEIESGGQSRDETYVKKESDSADEDDDDMDEDIEEVRKMLELSGSHATVMRALYQKQHAKIERQEQERQAEHRRRQKRQEQEQQRGKQHKQGGKHSSGAGVATGTASAKEKGKMRAEPLPPALSSSTPRTVAVRRNLDKAARICAEVQDPYSPMARKIPAAPRPPVAGTKRKATQASSSSSKNADKGQEMDFVDQEYANSAYDDDEMERSARRDMSQEDEDAELVLKPKKRMMMQQGRGTSVQSSQSGRRLPASMAHRQEANERQQRHQQQQRSPMRRVEREHPAAAPARTAVERQPRRVRDDSRERSAAVAPARAAAQAQPRRARDEDREEENIVPGVDDIDEDEQERLEALMTRRRRQVRRAWTNDELDALEEGMRRHGTQWAVILRDDDLGRRLAGRSQVQLKDKARNEKKRRVNKGLPMGPFKWACDYPGVGGMGMEAGAEDEA
ncbi:hypothetical protein HK102_006472 [Quaeritorhiza haematococci]|nr:hypothetical protein HK102_006472 [Quaeritorhiza haematococci]